MRLGLSVVTHLMARKFQFVTAFSGYIKRLPHVTYSVQAVLSMKQLAPCARFSFPPPGPREPTDRMSCLRHILFPVTGQCRGSI